MSKNGARVTDTAIQLTAIGLLAVWCFQIVAPFLAPGVWGVVIAVAASGFHARLVGMCGGRTKVAAAVFISIGMAVLVIPVVMLSDTLASGASHFAAQLAEGTIHVPPPPPTVADWPFIGGSLYPFWQLASENLQAAVEQLGPQLRELSRPMLAAAGSASLGVLQMMLSIVIAAVLLGNADDAARFAQRVATRITGTRGNNLVALSGATVSSVAVGILGVAVIQSLLAAVGFMVAGIGAAGLLALFVLIAAVIQLPVVLVMLPIIIYEFTVASTTVAVLFAVWCTIVALVDNVLKPIFFAKGGADVPVLVIFLGSIGGMMSSGLIGLFIGPVVLAVAYEVTTEWIAGDEVPSSSPTTTED